MNVLNVSLAQATSQEFGRSLGMKQYQHAHIYAISGLLNSGFILSLFFFIHFNLSQMDDLSFV